MQTTKLAYTPCYNNEWPNSKHWSLCLLTRLYCPPLGLVRALSRFLASPHWTPSWKGTSKFRLQCEDGHPLLVCYFEEAIWGRSSIWGGYRALFIVGSASKDSHNHCVPLLDVLHPPVKDGDRDLRILVMPLLRTFDSPIFEAIECIRQLFKVILNILYQKTPHRLSSLGIAVYAWKSRRI